MLPPCKDNLKLHISRANYVADMYVNATRLRMCLDHRIYHGWKQDATVQWKDDYFAENITDVLETCGENDGDCVNEYEFTDDKICDTSDFYR